MLDIETLDTGVDAVICSIGAVKFDPNYLCTDEGDGPAILDKFHIGVDFVSAQQSGGTIGAGTVGWWMHGDRDSARQLLLALDRVDLASALDGFAHWMGPVSLPVWGNGATFDNTIVRRSFERVGLETPWKFWHDRCYRTLASLDPQRIKNAPRAAHHDALADAEWQALRLQEIAQTFGLVL